MSIYNSETYLSESIKSILAQTYSNFEFLILDDCSTDNSVQIINSFVKKDARIRFYKNNVNLGLTKNLNRLILYSKGEFIARMDADDISLPERIEKQVHFLNNNPSVSILGTNCLNIDNKDNVVGKRYVPETNAEILKLLPKLSPMNHPTVMFRKSVFDDLKGYNEQYKTSQDLELWFRAASRNYRFHNLQEDLLLYRMSPNYSKKKHFKNRINEFKIKLKGYRMLNYPFYKYGGALVSLVLAISPSFLFNVLKKFDPR